MQFSIFIFDKFDVITIQKSKISNPKSAISYGFAIFL